MRKLVLSLSFCFACLLPHSGRAQGIHFSQYYNTPMLLSPANAGLMPDKDYRAGINYRNQWSNLPAPFHTFSAFGDFKLLENFEKSNWLGIGAAVFNDKAGDGNLSLFSGQVFAAYHLQMGEYSMLSAGIGLGLVQRSVNFSRLTFDTQWDGFTFNPQSSNGETNSFQKTSYADISAGLNYAFFPNENLYFQLGGGLLHFNSPTESFYGQQNKLSIRPTGNLDMLFKLGDNSITNFSAYYSYQRGASELVYGLSFSYNVMPRENAPTVIILGIYNRLGDAIIPTVGLEWNNVRFTSSLDVSVSGMSPNNGGNGAFEFSIIYQGSYGRGLRNHSSYGCPRF
jgi:type IX secretion system PorP/SprF family membrane protein